MPDSKTHHPNSESPVTEILARISLSGQLAMIVDAQETVLSVVASPNDQGDLSHLSGATLKELLPAASYRCVHESIRGDVSGRSRLESSCESLPSIGSFTTSLIKVDANRFVIHLVTGKALRDCDSAHRSIEPDSDEDLKQLIRREDRNRAIIDSIGDGVAISDKHGRLEYFNPVAEQILGIQMEKNPSEEWSSFYGLYAPDGETPYPTDQLPLVRALEGDYVENTHMVVRSPTSAEPRDIIVIASPFFDAHGELDGAVAVFKDVSDRMRAERLLKEAQNELENRIREVERSQAKYHDLYENSPDMYLTVDAKESHIIECNQTLSIILGYSKDELIGMHVQDLVSDQSLESDTTNLDRFLDATINADGELTLKSKEGWDIDVSTTVSIDRNEAGQINQFRCVWRDITLRKRAEESLNRAREELAHITRVHTAGEMATGLAHELNQPLNAIVNYARGFSRRAKVGTQVTEALHQATREISQEAERAANIIAGLRRLVAKRDPSEAISDFNEIVQKAIMLCTGEARRHDISIVQQLADDLPPAVCDPVQLKQVIICLTLNAVDALSEHDIDARTITVTTRHVHPDAIELSVQDNGPGVPADNVLKVFDAFYSTKPKGMGMGLAICRSIIENHLGSIWVESTSPLGTVLRFSIPSNPKGRR